MTKRIKKENELISSTWLLNKAKELDEVFDNISVVSRPTFTNAVNYLLKEKELELLRNNVESSEIEDEKFKEYLLYYEEDFWGSSVEITKDKKGLYVLKSVDIDFEGIHEYVVNKGKSYEDLFNKEVIPSMRHLSEGLTIKMVHKFPELIGWMKKNNIKLKGATK